MESEGSGEIGQGEGIPGSLMGLVSWRTGFVLGLITLILGVIITFRPTQSLVGIAILVGIVMMVSGVYHVVRAISGREHERLWRAISGVLFILAGLVLLRHLHLTVALIGLFVGFTWIIQGVAALVEGFSGGYRGESGWSIFFGIISLIAGIVVVSAPIASVSALTIFLGIWFIIMGAIEMFGALAFRRAVHRSGTAGVNVPQQRADTPAGRQGSASQGSASQAGTGQGVAGQATAATSRSESRDTQG
jgi:uncharacterized membrane protein HdeD (DUF308 family)